MPLVGSSSALWPSHRRTDGRTDAGKTHLLDGRTDGRKIKVCARSSQSKGKHLSGAVSFLSRDAVPGRYFDTKDSWVTVVVNKLTP